MAEAKIDDNNISTMQGVLNTDGATTTNITISPTTCILDVSDGSIGSDFGGDNASRDDNRNPVLLATDGSNNIIPLYVDSSGNLLIDST